VIASRFDSPSVSLGLTDLLRRTRKVLGVAALVAILGHMSLVHLRLSQAEQKAAKPLTTQFVKHQPRLTKPLELKKRPQPRRRQVHRQMVAVKAQRLGEVGTGRVQTFALAGRLARPSAAVSRAIRVETSDLEPLAAAQMIEGEKEAKHIVDMSLEMLDIGALDTGRYDAMVVQDPNDKRNIRGFFRLKYAYSQNMRERDFNNFENRILQALTSLIEAMNRYTHIKTTFEARVTLHSRELLEHPWVFVQIGPYPLKMDSAEEGNLGRYLTSGGFVFCDALDHGVRELRNPACLHNAVGILRSSIESRGLRVNTHWSFDRVPDTHPVYSCYFDFDGLPGGEFDPYFVQSGYLRGAAIDNRLVAILSNKGMMHYWGERGYQRGSKNERMIQFGINTIIFALTQEGSITRRVMDALR